MRSGGERNRTPIKMQTVQQSTLTSTSSPQRNKSALASRGLANKERSDNKENGLNSSPRAAAFTMKVSPFNQRPSHEYRKYYPFTITLIPRRNLQEAPNKQVVHHNGNRITLQARLGNQCSGCVSGNFHGQVSNSRQISTNRLSRKQSSISRSSLSRINLSKPVSLSRLAKSRMSLNRPKEKKQIDKEVVDKFSALLRENNSLREKNFSLKQNVDDSFQKKNTLKDKLQKVRLLSNQTQEKTKIVETEIQDLENEIIELKRLFEANDYQFEYVPNTKVKITDRVIDTVDVVIEEEVVDPREEPDRSRFGNTVANQITSAGNNQVLVTRVASRSVSNTKLPRRAPAKPKEVSVVMEYDERAFGS